MKKIKIVSTLLLSLWFASTIAQPGPPHGKKREEIEAMKIGFITKKLNLTPEEAQSFWPVYNVYQEEVEKLRDNRRKEMKAARDEFDTMEDKEVEKLVEAEIAFRQSELDILKKYHPQFKKSLPIKKVAKLYRAEDDFKRELIQKIQNQRDGGRPSEKR
ncbi:MAG: hypothetical protein IPP71_19160 [Bacteroidetes bacterium]|nr:hypothetical protein [Bacteroidota bacterium]